MPDEGVTGTGPTAPRRPRARFTVVLGILWLVVPLVLFLLDRSVLLAGNPAQVIALAASGLIGVVLLVRDRSDPTREAPVRPWLTVVGRVVAVLATVVVLGALIWLRPFGATPAAVAAMSGSADVRVTDAPAHIVIEPTSGTPTRGLVFQPGARVDPRAYVPMLSEVSRQGVIVFIVKQPFGIGFLAMTAPHAFIDRHPEVTSWTLAGHSLGGVVAATFAHDHPASSGDSRSGRPIRSTRWPPQRPRRRLGERHPRRLHDPGRHRGEPAAPTGDTAYTAVEGGVHAFFGDYGEQPGDGTPTVTAPRRSARSSPPPSP